MYPPYGARGIRHAVNREEEAEPGDSADDGHRQQRRRAPYESTPAVGREDHDGEHRRKDREARVQPGQDGQRATGREQPPFRRRLAEDQRRDTEHHDHAAERVGIDDEGLKEKGHGKRHGRPAEPARGAIARQPPDGRPCCTRRRSAEEREQHDHAGVSEQRERGSHDDGQTRRVYRVDLLVGPAA